MNIFSILLLSLAFDEVSSDTKTTGLIISLVIAAIAILGTYAVDAGKKRTEALLRAATQMGFSFQREGDALLAELSENLHLLTLGSFRKLNNVMLGSSEAGATALFEYNYTEGGGQQQKAHHQTVAAFRFPARALPDFYLGAEHWWHKAGKAFGYKIIEFDSHPEFGKRYLLRGENEEAVRQFFCPPLLDYFESLPEKPIWSIEAAAPWLIVYLPAKLAKPDQLRDFRDSAAIVARNMLANAAMRRSAGS
jgi:hypothetical protein